MKRIFKYPLHVTYKVNEGSRWESEKKITMSKGAKVLSVGVQQISRITDRMFGGFLWALVDLDAEGDEERTFHIYATGRKLDDDEIMDRHFIGTLIFGNGEICLHVFE